MSEKTEKKGILSFLPKSAVKLTVKNSIISAIAILVVAAAITVYLAMTFTSMWKADTFYPGEGVTQITKLSQWYPKLANTKGDTDVYILEGAEPGDTLLVLGGTHANEPAGVLSAVYLLENLKPTKGKVIIIPQVNVAGFTCTDPQEAAPMTYTISADGMERTFRYGSRATNPIYQWPDPDIYVHASSGQQLSGSETRNLNRAYPGRETGTFTESIAYAVTELIKAENAVMSIDLHEASPEYPNINSVVAHENAAETAAYAKLDLEIEGVPINLENSPKTLHGLTHRELGDFTDTLALLMETSNPAQGRLRGATNEHLVITGQDKYYFRAGTYGRLYVPFTEEGHPIAQRVARHVTAIHALVSAYNEQGKGSGIDMGELPSYDDLCANLYSYLVAPTKAN